MFKILSVVIISFLSLDDIKVIGVTNKQKLANCHKL